MKNSDEVGGIGFATDDNEPEVAAGAPGWRWWKKF